MNDSSCASARDRSSSVAARWGGLALAMLAGCSLDLTGRASFDSGAATPDADAGRDADADAGRDGGLRDAGRDTGDARADSGCVDGARVCEDDVLRECASGDLVMIELCSAGCDDDDPRCLVMVPANVDEPMLLDEGGADVVLGIAGSPWSIDTDTGAIVGADATVVRDAAEGEGMGASGIGFHVQPQVVGAPELAIFTVRSLVVEADVLVTGRGGRSLVVLASGDVAIEGVIDVGAALDGNLRSAGPGGSTGAEARASAGGPGSGERGQEEFALQSGGGGGGHGGRGGDGGDSTDLVRTVRGGTGGDDYVGTEPLRGGGGGGGGASRDRGGVGGGGGGGLQISARGTLRLGPGAVVRSPGAGGGGASAIGGAGGGGGAGGSVVLEATTLVVEGRVAANGGGGGAGREGLGTHDGARGGDGADRAPGGEGPGLITGDGGGGGAGDDASGTQPARDNNPGGGGGGAGRVLLRSRDPSPVLLAQVSPTDPSASAVEPLIVR